jgi:hypothetical protein
MLTLLTVGMSRCKGTKVLGWLEMSLVQVWWAIGAARSWGQAQDVRQWLPGLKRSGIGHEALLSCRDY